MLFALYCVDKPDGLPLRKANRADHIAYLEANNDRIVHAGATLTDDGQRMIGSLMLVNMPDRAAVEAFSAGDPFSKAGVFESVVITRVSKTFWNPQNADDA